jgi:uncharacterized membrane protein
MNSIKKLKIWHVGNWCVHTGQKYVESPFQSPSKGVEILNYAKPLIDALKEIPDAEVISEPSWELYNMSPELFDERLRWATSIIFADVETKCLMLHPDFFTRAKWGDKPVTFPDRFDLLKNWINEGGHFHMNGGWYSFTGELGKGGWRRSRLHNVFPVECLEHDDLIESTDGYKVRCNKPEHPVVAGIDWSAIPPLLGFNETKIKSDATSLVDIKNGESWHPLFAFRNFGDGVVSGWMTGASPHWGINFMKWKFYKKFWQQVFMFSK